MTKSNCDTFSKGHKFAGLPCALPPRTIVSPYRALDAASGWRVLSICSDCHECVRLRELGFCDAAEVCKVADGGAMICLLNGMRVAIGRELATHVRVERVAA